MYLKKLELLGFKSFADRTEFHFAPGITGIVGPNGCGKSNVVDAFKWIFGTQSAKGLRGSEMKDVIFNGTQSRKPTGFAEVSVVFDNDDRFLNVDYAEVSITRRLYRSGESEYLINRQRCRLKDLKDLFLDTGIGTSSYSILEQGKIDVLLQSSTQDRRIIFEEAAGISRYRVRKAEALRSLLRVEENLKRLQDIIDEVEKQVRRVKVQAGRARRYRELADRLKELRVRLAVVEFQRSVDGRADLSFRLWWLRHETARFERREQRIAALLEERQTKRRDLLAAMQALNERVAAERIAQERARERIEQGLRRVEEIAAELERKQGDLEKTVSALAEIKRSLETQVNQHHSLRERCTTLGSTLATREEESLGLHRQLEDLQGALSRRKEDVLACIQRRSKLSNVLVGIDWELNNLRGRRERVGTALAEFQRQLGDWDLRRNEAAARRSLAAACRATLEAERAAAERAVVSEEGEIAVLGDDLSRRRAELARRSSRREVLRSFEENLHGVALSVAEVLRRQGELPPRARSHGMVGSLIKVERRFAASVEAVLADQAQALVVESEEGALDILDHARAAGLGRVEVLPIERVAAVDTEYFPRQGGVLGALRDVVEAEAPFAEFFDRLLANVVLVEDFATAMALARNGLRPFRLVTLAGEIVEPWGGISIYGSTEPGIISRRSELEDLAAEVALLEGECEELAQKLDSRRRALDVRRDELKGLISRLDDVTREEMRVEAEALQCVREAERLGREHRVGTAEAAELDDSVQTLLQTREARQADVRSAEVELAGIEEASRALDQGVKSATERADGARSAAVASRVDVVQAQQEAEGLRQLIDELARGLRERSEHADAVRSDAAQLESRGAEVRKSTETNRTVVAEAAAREAELVKELAALEAGDGALAAEEKALRDELERSRARARERGAERESCQLQDQEERHRRNSLRERIEEEYGLDLARLADDASDAPAPAQADAPEPSAERSLAAPLGDGEKEAAQNEIRELQEQIRRLGSVNLEALDELDELEARHRFQLEQRTDLVESERNLRHILGEINAKSREMFLTTFASVQEHFNELFRKCFGGGKAELVLEEGIDVLEAGIDIIARPPGKKLTTLSLMSGGEKTMTTIALLLAIFRSRPSPICVMDEVDAALDETNVGRFVFLLREFLSHSQFIVITHNKVTMAESSTLYGVTMPERGVSKRVSVELESYDPQKLELASTDAG